MQISVQRDTYPGHRRSPWLVVVPRRLSSSGKRVYRRFATKAAAGAFAGSIRNAVRAQGEHPIAPLTLEQTAEVHRAQRALEGSGLTLLQAAQLMQQLLQQHGSVASLLNLGEQGSGEAERSQPSKLKAPRAIKPTPDTPARPAAAAAPRISLRAAIEAMSAAKAHHAPSSVANRAARFRTLLTRNPDLADTPLARLSSARLEAALNRAWPDAASAWNDCHKHLTSLYNYAIRKGLCERSPMPAIDRRHDVHEREITALPPSELRALFAACRPATAEERAAAAGQEPYLRRLMVQDCSDCAAYIALCAFAGVRPAECARLRWQDISEDEGVVSVRAAAAKTGGTRHIELHPTLAAWLRAQRPPDAAPDALITPQKDLKWRLRCIRRRAGYGDDNPWQDDVLRHSYATYYLKSGGDLNRLQLNMGHRDIHLLYTRYTNMVGITRAMAAEWWQVLPP